QGLHRLLGRARQEHRHPPAHLQLPKQASTGRSQAQGRPGRIPRSSGAQVKPRIRMSRGEWLCSLGITWGRGPTPAAAWLDMKRREKKLDKLLSSLNY